MHLFPVLLFQVPLMCCLYQPFMSIWMRGQANLMLSDYNVFLLCGYFYAITMVIVRNLYSEGAGLFWEFRYCYALEATGNIILNYLFGKLFGITGIILASLITVILFNFIARNIILFMKVFKGKQKEYYSHIVLYLIVSFLNCALCFWICSYVGIGGITGLLLRATISFVVANIFYYLLYSKTKIFNDSFAFFRTVFLKTK